MPNFHHSPQLALHRVWRWCVSRQLRLADGYSDLHPLAMWLFPAQWLFLAMFGVFMLRGFNWARWMLVAWVGYHTFQSIAHTRFELLFNALYYVHSPWEALAHMHVYIAILCIVFTPSAHRYFRAARAAG
jgi:hypothetical protein